MMSVTPMFRPNWVLVPQAVASMVSFLSLENPGTLVNISKLVKSRALDMPDCARMFNLLVAAAVGRERWAIHSLSVQPLFGNNNYINYLSLGQKCLSGNRLTLHDCSHRWLRRATNDSCRLVGLMAES